MKCRTNEELENSKIREEVKFVPARLKLIEYHQAVYKCPIITGKKDKKYVLIQERNILFRKGHLELSNNSAERSVKERIPGRKKWLSSSTFEGAQANAVALSLIYTAKLNHLDPEEYLRKVLTEITSIEIFDPERFRKFLPWNIT